MESEHKLQEVLASLKSILLKTGLTETIKWKLEVYTHQDKNIVGLAAFKNFVALWFFNGVFLKDEHKILLCSQEEKTKALRKWHFSSKEEINERLVLEYIREAIQNEEAGRVWKPQKFKPAPIPDLLLSSLNKDKALKAAFERLTATRQKEYIDHIDSTKREETKKTRLEKMIPMILQQVGINDKYK